MGNLFPPPPLVKICRFGSKHREKQQGPTVSSQPLRPQRIQGDTPGSSLRSFVSQPQFIGDFNVWREIFARRHERPTHL